MSLLIPGTNSIKDTGYDVANSARFNVGSSDNIQRTYGTPTNAKIFGLSWWVKLGKAWDGSGSQDFWGERADGSNRVFHGINADGTFQYFEKNGGSTTLDIKTNRLFRDNSAWYHFLLLGDSTQGTAANRLKLYINGVQETSFSTESYPSSDYQFRLAVGSSTKYFGRIGLGGSLSTNYYDGYLAEAVFVDGTVTAHTDYGEFDEDSPTIWKPKDVSGLTFGNNGFYLDFENASNLGADVSGNGNDFTVNNLTSIDQSIDTCTNNFATFDPINLPSSSVLSEGNLDVQTSGSSRDTAFSTIGVSKGKWYAEFKLVAGEGGNVRMDVGINGDPAEITRSVVPIGNGTTGFSFDGESAVKVTNGSSSGSFGSALSIGDIVMLAVDLDNLKIYFGKNGTFFESGDPTSGSTGTGSAFDLTAPASTPSGFYFLGCSDHSVGFNQNFHANFGSPPFSISSGNSDAEGFGNFEYAVPSGYYALNTTNLNTYG